ncbi:MAG TPA: hypothetical protein EYP43_01685, partial [Thermoplasmata archaeon]|nr:hypothetical protein [Thermoplasmata archaeon]
AVARTALLVRQALFVVIFLFGPLALGISLSLPVSGRNPEAAALHLFALLLTLLIGLSLSFTVTALLTGEPRRVVPWFVLLSPNLVAIPLMGMTTALMPGYRMSSLWVGQHTAPWWLLIPGLYLVVALSIPGILHMGAFTGRGTQHARRLGSLDARCPLAPPYGILVPGEYLQLRRSRGLQKIVGSYLFPLVVMTIMMAYVRIAFSDLDLHVGLFFYVPLVGLISTTIYSWENNIDEPRYLALLPISMTQVIRAKLILFYALAGVFSTVYVVLMGVYLGPSAGEIALAVPAAVLLSAYTGTGTAFLTGIFPNRRLYDISVLIRFFALNAAPITMMIVLSQDPGDHPALMALLLTAIAALTLVMWRSLDKRWRDEPFSG